MTAGWSTRSKRRASAGKCAISRTWKRLAIHSRIAIDVRSARRDAGETMPQTPSSPIKRRAISTPTRARLTPQPENLERGHETGYCSTRLLDCPRSAPTYSAASAGESSVISRRSGLRVSHGGLVSTTSNDPNCMGAWLKVSTTAMSTRAVTPVWHSASATLLSAIPRATGSLSHKTISHRTVRRSSRDRAASRNQTTRRPSPQNGSATRIVGRTHAGRCRTTAEARCLPISSGV